MVADSRSVATRPHRNLSDGATKFDETHPELSPLVTPGRRASGTLGLNSARSMWTRKARLMASDATS